jgi:hypothetical protein
MTILRSARITFTVLASMVSILDAQSADGEPAILARVGSEVVTEQEYVERFELMPGIHRQGAGGLESAKQEFLLSLVAEKLLAANAQRYGIDQSETIVRAMENVRRLLARDELYRDEVQRVVSVPAAQIAASIKMARMLRTVVYVFSDDRRLLDSLRSQVSTLAELVSGACSASLLVDTISVRWGEAETALEATTYGTKVGKVSDVVGSSVGWFLIGVLDESRDEQRVAQDPTALRSYVESRLRLRREEQRLDEFLGTTLKNVTGYGRRQGIRRLANALRDALRRETRDGSPTLSADSYASARSILDNEPGDTLAVMGDRWLSVEEGLDRLYASGARFEDMRFPALERHLNGIIREWVLRDLLETIALERGLDGRPQVVRQLEMWRDHYLSEEMVRRVTSQTKATDLDVYRAIGATDRSFPQPRLSVRVATGSSVTDVAVFVDAAAGVPRDSVPVSARGVSIREYRNEPVDRLGIVAVAAWPLSTGQWSKVTVVDSIALSVQLLERFVPELPSGLYDSIAVVVTKQKVRRATAEVVARLARSERIEVYDDRLRSLKVSSTPMMTYRLLGFGGRMFAVPFVRPQTDWIDRMQDSGPPVP